MNIKPADFVTVVSGREKGKCFVVLSVENQFLYLCDGKNRKLLNPKKKKIKHVSFAGEGYENIRCCLDAGITDKAIRRAISCFKGYLSCIDDIN